MTWLFKIIYYLVGWRTIGRVPSELKKAVWVVCPHWRTSDFLVGIGVRSYVNINIGYLGKSTLFKWYSSWFFKGLGGYPVDRSKSNNLVEAVANTFNQHQTIHIAIAPEGTRRDVEKLKTGFYYIALKANVPIVLVGFDYPRKSVVFGDVIKFTGDYVKDMKPFYDFYATIQGPKKKWLKDYLETGVIAVPDSKRIDSSI